ncbi:MAG: relaxase/mobilization nuclease domain-containing protein [Defluviitaleaceae bacterium]|nr:relaxase/mobilization nuclease domain-containing protein [Defluviitaleaceae bacterium]MCL2275473.1 relaxase/mobilization nuclease domain-containing protein [Defluviitaleaceae bacterium]
MATTAIIPIHASGRAVARALKKSVGYIENPNKTDNGEWVTSYECDPLIADAEFLFSKNQYAAITGRSQGKNDVLAYHLRISFKPGETDAATANRIGYDLAMKLTNGQHAFVCCTHTDRAHTHSHIVINSTNLDCTKKFRNFKGSTFVVRKIADQLCLENGLSIIENPNPSCGSYGKWQGDERQISNREKLKQMIDEALVGCDNFNTFLANMKSAGCEIKTGKHLSIKIPDASRFARLKSLGDDYTEEAIRERILGKRIVATEKELSLPTPATRKITTVPTPPPALRRPVLLINIQAKLQQAHSPGFEHYARIYNLKEMARTLIYLQERGIGTYDELTEKIQATKTTFNNRQDRLKIISARQEEITTLQRHIGTYNKTKDTYNEYRRLKKIPLTPLQKLTNATHPAEAFYEVHRADITRCEAVKKFFNAQGYGVNKKILAMQALRTEYAKLETEKKSLYNGYKELRTDMIDLQKARHNIDTFLGERHHPERTRTQDHTR